MWPRTKELPQQMVEYIQYITSGEMLFFKSKSHWHVKFRFWIHTDSDTSTTNLFYLPWQAPSVSGIVPCSRAEFLHFPSQIFSICLAISVFFSFCPKIAPLSFRLWPLAVFKRKLSWQSQVFKKLDKHQLWISGFGVRAQRRKNNKRCPLVPLSSIALVFYMMWSWRSPNTPWGDVSVASENEGEALN